MKKINILFFILLPFVDILTSITTRFVDIPISLGMIVKGLYLSLITIYIFFYSKSKHKKIYINYFIIVAVYSLLYFITKLDIINTDYLFGEVSSLFKLVFGSLLFFAFIVLYDDLKYKENDIIKVMLYSLITYAILLIVPTITHTNFNSYTTKNNEGSVGWFYAANDISSILLILYPFIYIFLNKKVTNKNKKTYLYYLLLIPIIYSFFIIGTKTSWLGIILETFVILILSFIKKIDKKNIIALLLVFISTVLLTFVSPTVVNINKENNRINNNITETVKKDTTKTSNITTNTNVCKGKTIKKLVSTGIYNKIHLIFSGRENKAYTLFLIYKDSSILEKLFGIGFSNTKRIDNCYVEKYVEIDAVDVFTHYGIVGLIIILIPFIYVIRILLKKENKLSINKLIYIFDALLVLGISFVAGHVIGYPTVNVYYSALLVLLIIKEKRNKEVKKVITHE